ncbi:MAG: ABC-F type ribosomal protection protein [Clostridia bacterium]|nr:ABC-F type ribosomal protection protein [Clostridia bacterium]
MIALSVNDISLEYGTDVILDKINFSINEGDRLGIVGVNGAGKSTLLKIICGSINASGGELFVGKGKSVAMLEQNAMLFSESSVFEEMLHAFPEQLRLETRLAELEHEIAHGDDKTIAEFTSLSERFRDIGGYEFRGRIKSMLARFGFPEAMHNTCVGNLSGGERTRLSLVRLLLVEPDILILDEPTNHLDTDTLEWLENHLRSYPKTLIIVSHDRYFLDVVATKMLEIEHQKAELYTGNYSAFAEKKAAARKALEHRYIEQQKEIARQEAYIEQQRRWNREKNIIAAESREKALARMEKIDAPKKAPKNIRLSFGYSGESGNDVIMAENLAASYDEKKIFEGISFLIKKNDRVLIIGPNGCGKSTLLKILGEKKRADAGEFFFGSNVSPAYYDQEIANLTETNTVLDEMMDSHEGLTYTQVRTALASFLFFAEDMEKTVSVLSGGERARLALCKIILSKVNLLILDEPTNHLDIGSREALEEALLAFDGTIIAVSHDRYFIKKLATRIFDMTRGFTDWKDDYPSFLAYKSRLKEEAAAVALATPKAETENKAKYLENKKLQSEIRKNERIIEKAEAEITKLDEEKAALEEESAGDAATNYVRLSEISARIAEIDERTEELFLAMMEAEEFLASVKE